MGFMHFRQFQHFLESWLGGGAPTTQPGGRSCRTCNKNDDNIAIAPKVAKRLEGCTQVSSKYYTLLILIISYMLVEDRGTGVNMLKMGSKRRRTVKQIKAEKAEQRERVEREEEECLREKK